MSLDYPIAKTEPIQDQSSDLPILVAAAIPPEPMFYETVTIDEPLQSETTPLVATAYSHPVSDPLDSTGPNEDEPSLDPVCRDWFFALLFLLQIAIVLVAGLVYSPKGYEELNHLMNYTLFRDMILENSDDVTPEQFTEMETFLAEVEDYLQVYPWRIFLWDIIPSGVAAFLLVHATMVCLMQQVPRLVVASSLICTVGLIVIALLVWLAAAPGWGTLFLSLVIGAAAVHYARLVWPIIPFASVNLKVALKGLSDNSGIYILALFSCEIAIYCALYWLYVLFGTQVYLDGQCIGESVPSDSIHSNGTTSDQSGFQVFMESQYDSPDCGQTWSFFLLLLSGYWTSKVLMVTVAGVMATWCYDKDAASGCCSPAVGSSFYRSITYSLGSVCFGSLLQGIMKILRALVPDSNRRSNEQCCGLCFCIIECSGRILEQVLEYFNQWAYVYIGVYGYSYCESGKRVVELFQAKGWSSIISERLASFVMAYVTVCAGILMMGVSYLFTISVDVILGDHEQSYVYGALPQEASLIVGFLVGTLVSAVMMSVLRGGVNTLIVCFADAPDKLQENHPELTREMINAWAEAFPSTICKDSFEAPTAEPIVI
eukprot:Nitzschia sp. Nitz4//scaffold10_size219509//182653//184590//NITZ4_001458-RA/size219509-augustus-gene-0.254-mRNA-1//1//CDS//3329533010//3480//frame0